MKTFTVDHPTLGTKVVTAIDAYDAARRYLLRLPMGPSFKTDVRVWDADGVFATIRITKD